MNRPSRRRAQVIAAGRAGDPQARDGLLGLLAQEEIPYWRAAAATLLTSWAHESGVGAALAHSLTDTNALVRAESARSLGPLLDGDAPGLAETLRLRLEDSVRDVRIAAAWALRATVDPGSLAGRELLHSMNLHADQPVGQMQKGAFALARNDPAKALAHFQKAVQWDPNSAPIRHELAVVLSMLNRPADAVAELEAAVRLEPRQAEYAYKLALAWNEVGDTAKTIAALERAVQLDPRHARALYNLGLALNSVGRTDEALAALARAESIVPTDPRNPYARATILARLNRIDEARQAAQRALEVQPGFAPARELLQALP
ncbi:MAG: tetratricopeptide repeat protein [Phycisphaeraceae bacterium]|nr:tetratricopeptide repeat protein [Phycisphaeraceae bacterium]